ncbi:MAG: hypothetical protein QOF48_3417 [Verrucomicrobiota bacterium]
MIFLGALGASGAPGPIPTPAFPFQTAPPPATFEKKAGNEAWIRQPAGDKNGNGNGASPIFFPASTIQYSIGDPTAEEQCYLELINRARMNPVAEAAAWRNTTDPDVLSAYSYFGVELDLMASQIAALSDTQPLSFHPQLLEAARQHTMDMYLNNYQGHIGSDGSNPGLRINGTGYSWNTYGENVFASARSVNQGHAGFEVDWGAGAGGMQNPAGHRLNIHNGNFREAGIGVTNGLRGNVGPQLVTQEFASRWSITPFITGVVYYDFNGNNAYDPGEGIGGVRVDVPGSAFFALSANSGGYSVPVTTNGAYNVTFSGASMPATPMTVSIVDGLNAKLDWTPAYRAPTLSGQGTIAVARPALFTFTPVGGATAYQWKQAKRVAAVGVEGAESGTNNFTSLLSTNYLCVQSAFKATGANAFHLAQPQPMDQLLNLNWIVRPNAGAQLSFASCLGWATPDQVARLQVSTNSGATWQDLWTRAGNSTAGQTAFTTVTASLAPYIGREILVRFAYDHTGGTYYYQTGPGVGWYIDDISCSNCDRLIETQVTDVSQTSFNFVPADAANYSLRVRARVGGAWLDWGPSLLTAASTTAIFVRITTMPIVANGRASFNFSVLNGSPSSFIIEASPGPFGPWSTDGSASVGTLVAGVQYRANCATSPAGSCFYRVAAR